MTKIAVTSPSFSKSELLRKTILIDFPDVRFNDSDKLNTKADLIRFLDGCDGAVIGLHQIDEDVLRACESLKIISKYGVGLDNIPKTLCQIYGVEIGWSGGVNRVSVAEQTLGFMIALSRNLYTGSNSLKNGHWCKNGGQQLSELTIGIIGYGYIGQKLNQFLRMFGCRVLVSDIVDHGDLYTQGGVEKVELETLLSEADIVTTHVDLNEKSVKMINADTLALMKTSAFYINTSRGEVVDQDALKGALKRGEIAGAALDVYEVEPPADQELLSMPNLICTPHISGNSKTAVEAMGLSAISHLKRFFNNYDASSTFPVEKVSGL